MEALLYLVIGAVVIYALALLLRHWILEWWRINEALDLMHEQRDLLKSINAHLRDVEILLRNPTPKP